MIVSIHQPNYLPWLGYFDKIKRSDYFVVFDNVQFPRGKNHFGHRNHIKTNTGSKWLTVSVKDKSSLKPFNIIEVNDTWQEEHIRLIEAFYRKAPHFNEYYPSIKELILADYKSLSDLNLALIKYFLEVLEIETKVLLSSEICPEELVGLERILYIIDELQATEYISGTGPGSMRYIDEEAFFNRGVKLTWQHYKHPEYSQQYGEFIPYMSIIDLLFNEGPNSSNII